MSIQHNPSTGVLEMPNRHGALVERVRSVTAELCAVPISDKREALLDELATLTGILADLIVAKRGRRTSLHLVGARTH